MQKVEGSSPFIRFVKALETGLFVAGKAFLVDRGAGELLQIALP